MGKLLSIIMPTYNRAWIMPFSLSLIKDQIIRNSDDVELVVCNNASTDETEELLTTIEKEEGYLRVVNYIEHAEIGISISRAIDKAEGRFFLLWGDDDIPDPYMVDVIVRTLKKYPDVACLHFNRMQGITDENVAIKNLKVFYNNYEAPEIYYSSSTHFIEDRWRGMTFLSVDLLSVESWKEGKHLYTTEHYGFEYLAPFLYGINGKPCVYINYPLCIQRMLPKPVYNDKWPAYLLVGLPRMLKQMEELQVLSGWKKLYSKYQYNLSTLGYLHTILYKCTLNTSYYRPFIKEINEYQESKVKKMITFLLYLPDWVNQINREFVLLCYKVRKIFFKVC